MTRIMGRVGSGFTLELVAGLQGNRNTRVCFGTSWDAISFSLCPIRAETVTWAGVCMAVDVISNAQ